MKLFLIIFFILWIWLSFEFWRAPLMEETENGGLRIIRPAKKISDLFKRKNKTNTYSDLEKKGRGRSKY